MARPPFASVFAKPRSSISLLRGFASGAIRPGVYLGLALSSAQLMAQANRVRITGLTDLNFGTVTNLGADAVRTDNVCVFSNSALRRYRITGTGSGAGGAFSLLSGSGSLAYEVQWNQLSGQASGTQLFAGVPLTGQTSTATQQRCVSGPSSSGSLIVVLRSSALQSAAAGGYSGVLTLVVGPE